MSHDQHILLVENNEKEANTLKLILEGQGFNVDTAYSGWAAVEKLKVRKYGSVILDFGLADMKGDELAEKIMIEDPGTGIILLTGFKPVIEPVRLDKFDYVFKKPADPKKILEAMRILTKVVKKV